MTAPPCVGRTRSRCRRISALVFACAVFGALACASDPEETTCSACRAPSYTCSRGAGIESITLLISARAEQQCNADATVGFEHFRITCAPLEVCKQGTDICYAAELDSNSLRFVGEGFTYTCYPKK